MQPTPAYPITFARDPNAYYYGGYQQHQPGIYQAQFQQQVAAAVAPLQQQLQQQTDLIAKMQARDVDRDIEVELAKLAAEKIVFDKEAEKKELLELSPEKRAIHFDRMRKNYRREGRPGDTLPNAGGYPVEPIQLQRVPVLLSEAAEPASTMGKSAMDMAIEAKAAGARSATDHFAKMTNGAVPTR